MSAFLGQENNKLYFFLHALIVFYEQASNHRRSHFLTEGLFLVTLIAMESRLSNLAICGFRVRTSLRALQSAKLPSFGGYSIENLQQDLSRHVLHNTACFGLRAHNMRVETGWQFHNRHYIVIYDKCPGRSVWKCAVWEGVSQDNLLVLLRLIAFTLETRELFVLTTSVLRMWNCLPWSRRTIHYIQRKRKDYANKVTPVCMN